MSMDRITNNIGRNLKVLFDISASVSVKVTINEIKEENLESCGATKRFADIGSTGGDPNIRTHGSSSKPLTV